MDPSRVLSHADPSHVVVHASGGGISWFCLGGSCVRFWRGHVDLRGMKQSDSHFNRKILAFGTFFWQFTTVYNSLLFISRLLSDVKPKHLQSAGKKRLEPDWCTRSLAQHGGGSGQLTCHKMNFTFKNSKINIQTYMFNQIHTLFVRIVLAPKVSPTIEMMNKWGSDDLKSADNSD